MKADRPGIEHVGSHVSQSQVQCPTAEPPRDVSVVWWLLLCMYVIVWSRDGVDG